jgi:predicted metal-dependent enzyme (double-stranded beta helix superfamily)
MAYTLEEFCRDCAANLEADRGPGGRQAVRRDLERLLAERAFVDEHVMPAAPGRHTLYEDPEHGFVVLAHIHAKGSKSPPHDHGRSWAVYGQVTAYTEMTEWRRVDGGDGAGTAALEVARRYRLEPGRAGIYDIGAIHAIDYPDGARFVRVTGTDLEHVPRLKYNLATGRAEVIESVSTS